MSIFCIWLMYTHPPRMENHESNGKKTRRKLLKDSFSKHNPGTKTIRKKKQSLSKEKRKVFTFIQNLQKSLYDTKKTMSSIMIGVLTLPVTTKYRNKLHSALNVSYVKWLQKCGVSIVPIHYDLPKHNMKILLGQVHGILFTGGSIENKYAHTFTEFKSYVGTCKYIYDYVLKSNNKGNYYPIFGICLGFQILGLLGCYTHDAEQIANEMYNRYYILGRHVKKGTSNITFYKNDTKIKSLFSPNEQLLLENNQVCYHNHTGALNITKEFTKHVNIVSTQDSKTQDLQNQYITAFEFKKYPFYGTLYHPEKVQFEKESNMSTNRLAIHVSDTICRFFANECKKNKNIWIGGLIENSYLISNYKPYSHTQQLSILENKKSLKKTIIKKNKVIFPPRYLFGQIDKFYFL